jgi:hypothetical protein
MMVEIVLSPHAHPTGLRMAQPSKYTNEPKQKIWLISEQTTGIVRKVENHPTWGKQYLVTTHSNDWGPETYWVKESNVEQVGGRHG